MISPNSFSIKTLTGSDAPIYLHPTWDYAQRENKFKQFNRSQGGKLNFYSLNNDYNSFSFPLTNINSSVMSTINGWWESQSAVLFDIDGVEEYPCRISNMNKPINMFSQKSPVLYDGVVNLETIKTIDQLGYSWILNEIGTVITRVARIEDLGGGIVLCGGGIGTGQGDVYKSEDYGDNWTKIEMGADYERVFSLANLENGIALAGMGADAYDGDMYRSEDYGSSWAYVHVDSGLRGIASIKNIGSGSVVCGGGISPGMGDIYRSGDYGSSWTRVLNTDIHYIFCIENLENGIMLAGGGDDSGEGNFYRSIDYGSSWVLMEVNSDANFIYDIKYLENGIVLAAAGAGANGVYRSIDYGSSWTFIDMIISETYPRCFEYLGKGIVLAGTGYGVGDASIYKSEDYGNSWRRLSTFYSGSGALKLVDDLKLISGKYYRVLAGLGGTEQYLGNIYISEV